MVDIVVEEEEEMVSFFIVLEVSRDKLDKRGGFGLAEGFFN